MSKHTVVKANTLIQAGYTLDTVEQRLILLAIAEARETGKGISENSVLEIHATSYINTFDVERHTAYKVLKEASKSLFDRYVTYHDTNPKTGKDRSFHCRWVDLIGYEPNSGIVYLRFTQDVVPLITRLEENFTKYELQQVAKLTSAYAIRLYELLIQWRSVGSTPIFDVKTFRTQLGVESIKYKTMSNFKKVVLDFALQQVNEHTDIIAEYKQIKTGRSITGIMFKFSHKKIEEVNTVLENDFYQMTDAQINNFGNQLSELSELSYLADVGKSYADLAVKIKKMLKDPLQQKKLHPHLKTLGFNYKKK